MRRKVLIWGKTYPELSKQYDETVCTAGCLEDGSPIRLYPVPFRSLDIDSQFKLYNWVEVDIVKNQKDNRPESYKLNSKNITIVGKVSTHDKKKLYWASRYTVKEIAKIWNMHPRTVYDIPESELQRVYIGPMRKRFVFRGEDLIRYEARLPPADHKKKIEEMRLYKPVKTKEMVQVA